MENIGENLKDWQKVVKLVVAAPGSTAPELGKLLGKPANSALGFAVSKGHVMRIRRKDRTKWFPNVGSWVYLPTESAQ